MDVDITETSEKISWVFWICSYCKCTV